MRSIYLASQSPRRRQLLDQLGVAHELLLPEPHEDAEALEATRAGEAPSDYVQRVTRAKLDAACERLRRLGLPQRRVLCADTTVALGHQILGKPADAQEAVAMLQQLSGRMHEVHTAVAVADGSDVRAALCRSRVWVAELSEAAIADYAACTEADGPMGKAGAYAVQGRFAAWIARIDGSYTGIMGLPLFETATLLRD
ncbi:MAG: septum formation inhibitor Maf [Burkholderiales bacterium]|nr:septum formation inhibitor Maf [Burkholderiales bacterium]